MKNCDLRMNRCPTAGAEGEGMFSGVEPDVGAREEEGEGLRRVHDAGLFIVLAAQCGGIQDLSSSSRGRTHAACIRSVES